MIKKELLTKSNENYQKKANTTFLEKGFVVATILNVKSKYFDENFVTFKELNCISNLLQQIFNNNNLDVILTNEIDQTYFNIGEVIVLNARNNVSLAGVRCRYQGFCSINILKILWNEQLILDEIINLKLLEIENARERKKILNSQNESKLSIIK